MHLVIFTSTHIKWEWVIYEQKWWSTHFTRHLASAQLQQVPPVPVPPAPGATIVPPAAFRSAAVKSSHVISSSEKNCSNLSALGVGFNRKLRKNGSCSCSIKRLKDSIAKSCQLLLSHKAKILEQIWWIYSVHTIAWGLRILPQFPQQWFLICCLNSNFGLCTICSIVLANCRSRGPIFSAFTKFGAAAHAHSQMLQQILVIAAKVKLYSGDFVANCLFVKFFAYAVI